MDCSKEAFDAIVEDFDEIGRTYEAKLSHEATVGKILHSLYFET